MAAEIQLIKYTKNVTKNTMENIPDYKRIYTDIINEKYPEKKDTFKIILSKNKLSLFDVINCNRMLVDREDESTFIFNQKLHSFGPQSILEILDYQKRHRCTNTELARHFKLSRNTITKWKKLLIKK